MKSILRFLLLGLGVLVGLSLLSSVLFLLIGITLDLSGFRTQFESAATAALGREIEISGPIEVVPNLWPTVELGGLRIANPAGWPTADLARMERARVQLRALPLLFGRVRIMEISASGVSARLERRAGGEANWTFDLPEPEEEKTSTPGEDPSTQNLVLVGVQELSLEGISVIFVDAARVGEPMEFEIEKLVGSAAKGEPLAIEMNGSVVGQPYSVSVSTGSLADLMTARPAWPVDVALEVSGLTLGLRRIVASDQLAASERSGIVRKGEIHAVLQLEFSGERLTTLDPLLGVSLPPWGPYAFSGRFASTDQGYYATDVSLQVGGSRLTGGIGYEDVAAPRRIDASLTATGLQLDDFGLGEWSPAERPAAPAEPAGAGEAADPDVARVRSLLDPQLLRRWAGRVSIDVGEVHSGSDSLGRGSLLTTLENGRIEQAIALQLPGGAMDARMELEPRDESVDLDLRLRVDSFDYGVLARRADPATEMAGLLGLSLDLQSTAPEFRSLMRHANGRLGFAVFPEEFEAGVLDFWAVNLIHAVAPALDGDRSASKINCAVGLFSLEEGRLLQDAILLDTSHMEVEGEVTVDFATEKVDAVLVPSAKRPEFLSLATPVRIDGEFSDFAVGVAPADLLGTVVRVATDVAIVPIRRLVEGSVPEDGSEKCDALIREWKGSVTAR